MTSLSRLDRTIAVLLLVVFVGVMVHAPFSVALTTWLPAGELVWKSWKELLLGVALVLTIVSVTRRQQWRQLLGDRVVQLAAAYSALHVVMLMVFRGEPLAVMSGLLIDLRYVLFFVLVYAVVSPFAAVRRQFLTAGLVGASLVVLFGVLQATVLPHDVLRHLGYGPQTIAPYLTVDQNYDFARINSTLRGPNPLGIFAAIVGPLVLAYTLARWRQLSTMRRMLLGVLLASSAVIAWYSFSRSGLAAFGLALVIVAGVVALRRRAKAALAVSAGLVVAGALLIIPLSGTSFFKNVVLHEDPDEAGLVNSNDGHAESLLDGVRRLGAQPFGAGVGSTGSASLYGDQPVIIENQYLFVAHEVGWLGLVLFVALFILVLYRLWQRRQDWLALAVFASGVGIALAGLVLPVWVDDTVSIVWWGLAALALARKETV